jgi:hypothetical protein
MIIAMQALLTVLDASKHGPRPESRSSPSPGCLRGVVRSLGGVIATVV